MIHSDVSNDISGYKKLLKWLKDSVDDNVCLILFIHFYLEFPLSNLFSNAVILR